MIWTIQIMMEYQGNEGFKIMNHTTITLEMITQTNIIKMIVINQQGKSNNNHKDLSFGIMMMIVVHLIM